MCAPQSSGHTSQRVPTNCYRRNMCRLRLPIFIPMETHSIVATSVFVCVSVRCYRIKCCPCERETRISYVSITVEQRTCTGALSPVELPNVIEHGFLTSIHEFCGTHEDRIRPIEILCVWNASECVYAMCALQSRPPEPWRTNTNKSRAMIDEYYLAYGS